MQRLVVLLPDVHQVVLPSASAALLAERRRQRGGRHSQPLLQRLRKTALIRVNYSSSDESEQGSSMCSENHHMCSEVHVGARLQLLGSARSLLRKRSLALPQDTHSLFRRAIEVEAVGCMQASSCQVEPHPPR